jgi:hypothetical protein
MLLVVGGRMVNFAPFWQLYKTESHKKELGMVGTGWNKMFESFKSELIMFELIRLEHVNLEPDIL